MEALLQLTAALLLVCCCHLSLLLICSNAACWFCLICFHFTTFPHLQSCHMTQMLGSFTNKPFLFQPMQQRQLAGLAVAPRRSKASRADAST
jgi:hypothetical protein